jgi:hypothetical protein
VCAADQLKQISLSIMTGIQEVHSLFALKSCCSDIILYDPLQKYVGIKHDAMISPLLFITDIVSVLLNVTLFLCFEL